MERLLNCTCVETTEGAIFRTLMDFQSPKTAISYLKYYTDKNGTREKDSKKYSKFRNFECGKETVKTKYPNNWVYNQKLLSYVMEPKENIAKIYNPIEELRNILIQDVTEELKSKICSLVKIISYVCNIPYTDIGISGSNLVGLKSNDSDSDIDLLIYGEKSSKKIIELFSKLAPYGIQHYSEATKNLLLPRRKPETIDGFEQKDAIKYEFSKTSGQYKKTHFNISLIRNNLNTYPSILDSSVVKKLGFCIIEAHVIDDGEAIYVPPLYSVETIRVVYGDMLAKNVTYIIGSRFLHAQVAKKGDIAKFAGILQIREANGSKAIVITLEPWETVNGFIQIEGNSK